MTISIEFDSEACSRCGGDGTIAHYGHVLHGQCFKCNGAGRMLTPLGRSAYALYQELLKAAATFKEAWEIEVGDRIDLRGVGQYVTVRGKDFSSGTGGVVNGRCEGSALLDTGKMVHCYPPYAKIRTAPTTETLNRIRTEVKSRRKGAS